MNKSSPEDDEIRKDIVAFTRTYTMDKHEPPSVRTILRKFEIDNTTFYKLFKGIKEVFDLAGVDFPAKRRLLIAPAIAARKKPSAGALSKRLSDPDLPSKNLKLSSAHPRTAGEKASECFKILRKRGVYSGVVQDLVIELSITPEEAEGFCRKYCDLSNFVAFSRVEWSKIFERPLQSANSLPGGMTIEEIMRRLVEDHNDRIEFAYHCILCDGLVQLTVVDWKDILANGGNHYLQGHPKCLEHASNKEQIGSWGIHALR
jgi:hypothetical protein